MAGRFFDYDIADKTAEEIQQAFIDMDVVFVQGGNQFYLLKRMQECDFKAALQKFLAQGGFYFGESAGSIVCSQDLKEQVCMSGDEDVAELTDYRGLSLVNFLIKPHWNRQGGKREKYFRPVRENAEEFYSITQPIICLNDNQLVYVEGDDLQIWEGREA